MRLTTLIVSLDERNVTVYTRYPCPDCAAFCLFSAIIGFVASLDGENNYIIVRYFRLVPQLFIFPKGLLAAIPGIFCHVTAAFNRT